MPPTSCVRAGKARRSHARARFTYFLPRFESPAIADDRHARQHNDYIWRNYRHATKWGARAWRRRHCALDPALPPIRARRDRWQEVMMIKLLGHIIIFKPPWDQLKWPRRRRPRQSGEDAARIARAKPSKYRDRIWPIILRARVFGRWRLGRRSRSAQRTFARLRRAISRHWRFMRALAIWDGSCHWRHAARRAA